MNKKMMVTLAMILAVFHFGFAQDVVLNGVVKDSRTRKTLTGVNIVFPSLNKGCATDTSGRFSIGVPQGKHQMEVSLIGYENKVLSIKAGKTNKMIRIFLDEETTSLDEVEITAQKFVVHDEITTKLNVPLRDIPMTVSSLDKEMIEQVQVTSINDAMRYSTGVKPTVNYGGFQTFKLRGLGRPVIMVDGAVDYRMVISNSAPVTSLTAVRRIDYLKGPASVTHGHSADGGIINIVRNQPTDDFTVNFSTYYGSWKNKGAMVGSGGKLCEKVNYRFDAGFGDKDGWRDFAEKYANVYGALDFNFDEKNKLEARFGANQDFYATETGFPVLEQAVFDLNGTQVYRKGDFVKGFDKKQRYNDPQDYLKHKNINAGLNYVHHFSTVSKITFRNSYTYDYIDYFSTESLSFPTSETPGFGHYFEKEGKKTYIDLKNLTRSFPFRFAHETKTFQNSLDYTTMLRTGNIKHNLLAGYTFLLLDRTTFRTNTGKDITGPGKNATISVVNPVLNQGNLDEKFSSARLYNESIISLYVQDLIEFSEKLKALVALRFEHYDMDYQTANIETGKDLIDKTDKINQKKTPPTYRLGLVYEPIKDLSLYASYSNYFRPNRSAYGANAIYLNKKGEVFKPDFFDPETGYQAEIGFRYGISEKLQLNGSLYYINKENIVEYVEQTPEGNPVYAQIGEAESKGLELDVTYKPVDGLSITAGYTLSDAKYVDFSIDKYKAQNKGNALVRNPKNQLFLWSFYEVQKGFFKNLNLGFGVNYTDKMFTNATNAFSLPAYWLTEATIGYKLENNMYCKLKVNNLLNTEYYSNSVMSNQFVPGQERNFLFTVGYKF